MTTPAHPPRAQPEPDDTASPDVLIIGAGPTGLALAAQLQRFGLRFRIIDRLTDRGSESRALAIQARTIESLQSLGLGERLVAAGRTSTRLMLHFEDRVATTELGGFRIADTRYPFILFLSQAETERILNDHLSANNVQIERGVELTDFHATATAVECTLRHGDERKERIRTRYLVGCDGAHSTVRKGAEISFEGGTYPQDFALGDVEADGPLQRGTLHSFTGRNGVAMFFPLGTPSTWRVIAMSSNNTPGSSNVPETSSLSLPELQEIVDGATGGEIRLRDPAWLTYFHLHHRQTAHYRTGRIFLAGDAAHIHSPVGAQGMNTGIQDAWNLGWKLALTTRGWTDEAFLDSYEAERWPVGRTLLRTTDRVFNLFSRVMSRNAFAAWFRREIVSRVLPHIFSSSRFRTFAFRFISEFRVRYRKSPIVTEGTPTLTTGPKAGDRLPDAPLTRDKKSTYLQQKLSGPFLHLLLCGQPDEWDPTQLVDLDARYGGLINTHMLVRRDGVEGMLVDETDDTFSRLGVNNTAQYLVRPDGYIAFRCAGNELEGAHRYLARWFSGASTSSNRSATSSMHPDTPFPRGGVT